MAGVSNIIIQNVAITHLNPQYVWGGDAIVMSDTNQIWVDHVTTSNLGRQHYSLGQSPNNAVTISNSFLNGKTSNSATCDGHTYWGMELVGTGDQITFYSMFCSYDLILLWVWEALTFSQRTMSTMAQAAVLPSVETPFSTPSTTYGTLTAAMPSKVHPTAAGSSKEITSPMFPPW